MSITKYRIYYAPCQYIEESCLTHALESREDYKGFTPNFSPYISIVDGGREYILR